MSFALAAAAASTTAGAVAQRPAAAAGPARVPRQRQAPTPARAQLAWLADASTRAPIPATELTQHVSTVLLNALGGAEGFNKVLAEIGPLTVVQVLLDQPDHVQAIASALVADLRLDAAGLIASMLFTPYRPTPASWAELDHRLHTLAPRVGFAAATLRRDRRIRLVHAVHGDIQRPLASAFKLYVLGALAHAIAAHQAAWEQILPIHEQWKSLPTGRLQDLPAGTPLTLRQYAQYMISISDNTAADHLIHLLGRDNVQQQLVRFGNRHPAATEPFPTTRELFVLKGVHYPALAEQYLTLPRPRRRAALDTADTVPRTDIALWTQPRNIDTIEWFAAPTDMCRALAGLWRTGDPHVNAALSINDSNIALDRSRYPIVWFKGGTEPGVITLNYLAHTADGRTLASSVLLADPHAPLNEATITPEALALARAGITLNTLA